MRAFYIKKKKKASFQRKEMNKRNSKKGKRKSKTEQGLIVSLPHFPFGRTKRWRETFIFKGFYQLFFLT